MRDAQFREVQPEIRRGCRTYQDVMAETAREARAQIDRDNANAYAEAVMATLDEGEARDHLVYLASPFTATREIRPGDVRPDVDLQAYRATCAASCAARMMEAGTLVYSPIAHGHALVTAAVRPLDVSYAGWMRHCLRMLRTCDELAVLAIDGWRESRGVQAEIAEARRIGIPVRFVDMMGVEVEVRDV